MSTVKFVPRDPIKPIFAIKLSPTIHRILKLIPEEEQLSFIRASLQINPKRVVGLKNIVDNNQNDGTMVVLFDYIYEIIEPKIEIPHDEKGAFLFKIYEIDFNKEINLEKLLEKL